ncbi:MAG: Hsp33 family molecular chaperone [Hyphomicrobiales bacterium]|nr:Hsp33 family molecular chaperone [Hyphomicrobiales bacterium]
MKPEQTGTVDMPHAGDDNVIPFHVEALEVRGRAVQLGPMINNILDAHHYPEPVSRLLAEAVCLCMLLGSSLKFDGKFIIQTESDGAVPFFVADFSSPGAVRAYAHFDEDKLDDLITLGTIDTGSLMGKGVLAMTIDQGSNTQRYQGIVSLDGQSLEEVADQYFRQSEQIPTKVRLGVSQLVEAVSNGGTRTTWRAGGLIAQFLPDSAERMRIPDLPGGDEPARVDIYVDLMDTMDDNWLEARSLVSTIGDDELTDPQIGPEQLLYRLFHQRGVRVHPALPMINKCGCSKQKIVNIISSFSRAEREEALQSSDKQGYITSKCEFCGKHYQVSPEEITG